MAIRKLEQTTNFLSLYLHHCGESKIPKIYHLWSAVSLIAACVGNNVWISRYKHKPLNPNLYVLLLGPARLGKGVAINTALKFVAKEDHVSLYNGKATQACMTSILATPRRFKSEFLQGSRMWYVTEELGFSVGSGPMADDWVKWMTAMYEGGSGEMHEGTRKHGLHKIVNHCMNWLAGSTDEWMIRSIPPEAIEGGFFARMIIPQADYNFEKRYYKPVYPFDYEEVEAHLFHRVYWMCRIKGEFVMSYDAEELEKNWVLKRPPPSDPKLFAIWEGEPALVLKLSMLVAVADMIPWPPEGVEPKDFKPDFTIQTRHFLAARELLSTVRKDMKRVISLGLQTRENTQQEAVRSEIKKAGTIQHYILLRKVSGRSINTKLLGLIVDSLVAEERVEKVWIGDTRKALAYRWKILKTGDTIL